MAQPQKQLSQEEQIKVANSLRNTMLFVFVGVLGAGYVYRDIIDEMNFGIVLFGVLTTFLISIVMMPIAAKKTDSKEKTRIIILMTLVESAILWGCVFYWVFNNVLNK